MWFKVFNVIHVMFHLDIRSLFFLYYACRLFFCVLVNVLIILDSWEWQRSDTSFFFCRQDIQKNGWRLVFLCHHVLILKCRLFNFSLLICESKDLFHCYSFWRIMLLLWCKYATQQIFVKYLISFYLLGTFGQVLECWDRESKEMVAIKIVRSVKKYSDAAMIEIDVLQKLSRNDAAGKQ